MVQSFAKLKHPFAEIKGSFASDENYLVNARVREEFSEITQIRVVFATRTRQQKLEDLIGTKMSVEMTTHDDAKRTFRGTVIEIEYLGSAERYDLFAAELRPWPWFLTQTVNNRIFQEKTLPDIITEVCSALGFTDLTKSLSGSYPPLGYVVQYNETDYDFLNRLMEEAGIYWYVDHSSTNEKLVLADGLGAHQPIAERPELEYHPESQSGKQRTDTIFEWNDKLRAVPGKVTLVDYNFETPNTSLRVTSINKKGSFQKNDMEVYSMGGHYGKPAEGDGFARIRSESNAHRYERFTGSCDVRTIMPGSTFTVKNPPRIEGEKEFLIVRADHFFQIERLDRDQGELERFIMDRGLLFPEFSDYYLNRFEVIRKSQQYRPACKTPWPDLSGVHTAVVTGPGGEEIYTDQYGRVKVQFHWDRVGQKDDKTTCWVRVLHPWVGKGYGMQSIPRIGQEVVIMFERNNADRPYIVGSVYNSVNMPPYALPDNMTQTGIKTESSKGGGGFNELLMEDKKGEEFVRLQSEKDYVEIIKNNATITIGLEKADPGDMSLEVNNDQTEVIGNNQTESVGNDRTREVGNNEAVTIGNDQTLDVGNNQTMSVAADQSESIGANRSTEIGADDTLSVGANQAVDIGSSQTTSIGTKGEVTASASYEIKVGSSSIKIEPTKITIKAMQVVIDADLTFKAKGGLAATMEGGMTAKVKGGLAATLQGGSMTTVKGGVVKIN